MTQMAPFTERVFAAWPGCGSSPPGSNQVVDPRVDVRALYEDGYARYRAELAAARTAWGSGARPAGQHHAVRPL
ncbi:hypothetical protein SBADM41S_01742 [Streptomyces badius]